MRWCLVLALTACQSFPGAGGDDDPAADAAGNGDGSGSGSGKAPSVFDPATTNVVVEIDYETGEQPYTGQIFAFGDTFEPTLRNIDRLFAGKKTLTIPTTLGQMQNVGTIDDEQLTVQDILLLRDAHRNEHSVAGTKTYYVLFVSGHFADGSGEKPGVLGVSIGDTIAMFKDVIASTSSVQPNVERYVEQSTLVHELAHSIGLVANGIPMAAPHKDADHGAHCNNTDCVMYWLNEGSGDAADFAIRRLVDKDSLLFDAACLADVDALTGGP